MRRISFVLFVLGGALLCAPAHAQCRGGGGTATGGATNTAALGRGLTGAGGILTGGQTLLTGPGSWTHQVMMAQAMQQQLAQQQMQLAMQQEQARQQKLANRKYLAEQHRTQLADSRQRNRALVAAKNGFDFKPTATTSPRYLAAN